MSLRKHIQLGKPGIVFGNLITLTGGFLLATHRQIAIQHLSLFFCVLLGVALVIFSACIFNNIYDKDIDSVMDRTKNRALVTGDVSLLQATIYGVLSLALGVLILFCLVNQLTLWTIVVGFVVYVGVYTVLKRLTIHATLLGGISGAVPPIAGYTAVVNNLDYNTLVLFLILFFWQVPHSYAIAMLHIQDYKKLNLPILPIVRGIAYTKKIMLVYLVLFVLSCSLLIVLGTADLFSFISCMFMALFWLYRSVRAYTNDQSMIFAKTVFRLSIIVITAICLVIG